jgi:hypothetical protein
VGETVLVKVVNVAGKGHVNDGWCFVTS